MRAVTFQGPREVRVDERPAPELTSGQDAVVSIDYNMSDKDQIRGRWIYNRITGIDNQPVLPAFYVAAPNNTYFYSLSEFHTFAPTLQNEFRFSYSRNVNALPGTSLTFPGLDAFPVITSPGRRFPPPMSGSRRR